MKINYLFLLLAIPMLLIGCSKDPDPVPPAGSNIGTFEFNITAVANGAPFYMNTPFEYATGKQYKVSTLKMYVSNIRLIKPDSSEVLVEDVALLDFSKNHKPLSKQGKTAHLQGEYLTFQVPKGQYIGVKFGIGVPSNLNNLNPTLYASTDPLSNQQGMHWDWNTGYRFVVYEGNILTATDTTDFIYHLGMNSLYKEYSYIGSNYAFEVVGTDRELQFIVEMDMNKLWALGTDTSIDPTTENITHSMGSGMALAMKLNDNIGKSMFVYTLLSPARIN